MTDDLNERIRAFWCDPQPCAYINDCPNTNEHSNGRRYFLHLDMAPVCEEHWGEHNNRISSLRLGR